MSFRRPLAVAVVLCALISPLSLVLAADEPDGKCVAETTSKKQAGPSQDAGQGVVVTGDLVVLNEQNCPALDETVQPNLPPAHIRRPDLCCYADNLPKNQIERIIRETQLLPPTLWGTTEGERYFVDTICWTGNGAQAATGRAQPATLTYSFPVDGITWGLSAVGLGTGPNALNGAFTGLFGAANLDRGREMLRQAKAGWRKWAGLSYQEVADDNSAEDQSTTHVATRGDVRLGGYAMGTGQGVLAYNAFPSAAGLSGVGGSDMAVNTSFFIAANLSNPASNYRYFRNVVSHEHGHGLSYIHSVPCNSTKLMEPFISTAYDQQQIDEIRGAQRNYGDRYAGNNSAGTAKDFGSLTSPAFHSIVERHLSTNGTAGFNASREDWFKFTLGSSQGVTISAAPTGGSYIEGQQSSSCSGTTSTIVASSAGNLNIELRDAAGVSVIQTANTAAAGSTETLSAGTLTAGTYTIRIFDVGPNANQIVQTYDFTLRVASSLAPPLAIAGLNKRIAANTNCFFMGDVNSQVNETGATITAYDWDLDGNGSLEVAANAEPSRQYPSNGVYNVTLRVTDSNAQTDTDAITVTVFGATTTVTNVAASSGNQGQTIPVTITGTNLKNVSNASQVTVSGTGVTVTGSPVPGALGTSVTGLSFMIAGNAPPGARNVTVSNADGTGTGNNLFTVIATKGDLNCDFVVDFSDADPFILAILDPFIYGTAFPGCDITRADMNGDGLEDGADIGGFTDLLVP